jgi:methionyl-tRNA formyltransferase
MRIAIIGQQAFGKAVLDAFVARGDTVAGVFVAPDDPGAKADALAARARELGLPVFPTANYSAADPIENLRRLDVDIGIMAYVLQFVPQSFCRIPRRGMIQFHPSLLPQHRGPSSINWPVILGKSRTGLTIFRPVDGLDEGPIILQKEIAIGPDDTVATLYFDKIFPLGVAALLEAADLVTSDNAIERQQNDRDASYEGWVRELESRINWANPVDTVYNLIRGCNPAPGAWTIANGRRLYIFDSRKIVAHTFAEVKGVRPGQVVATSPTSFTVHAQGGFIEVLRCRLDNGKKIAAGESGVTAGAVLGNPTV